MRIPNIRRRPLVSQQGLDLGLLCSQSYLLGIAIISLSISSYSLFIDSLGAQYIPYVDIAIALATSLVSYGFIRSQMRWGFATVAPHTIAIIACLLLILRFALQLPAMTWVTFALLVLDALLMTFMMILIDTQTGFLFTVREVKQYYPYVMGSFHAGAVTAGLAVPILVQWFGNVENILYVSVGAFALVCFFLYLTAKRYHTDTPPTLSMEPLP
ncbi:MAG: hypothetical protein R2932_60585, partial [Caldilineaceae bacterium]